MTSFQKENKILDLLINTVLYKFPFSNHNAAVNNEVIEINEFESYLSVNELLSIINNSYLKLNSVDDSNGDDFNESIVKLIDANLFEFTDENILGIKKAGKTIPINYLMPKIKTLSILFIEYERLNSGGNKEDANKYQKTVVHLVDGKAEILVNFISYCRDICRQVESSDAYRTNAQLKMASSMLGDNTKFLSGCVYKYIDHTGKGHTQLRELCLSIVHRH
ncbi:uncharacterized protein ASCRUDRAFT_74518 [Ascoidea rubescens DSM 1968]|uniref:Uncharacterized protein n=1 Tax=Ascoidea rubescens DSM 1968 TaxID=1344418 RepID=A0A1D2VNC9_9ASCO|nr:hypothetical protein ASCRUDRAFT_74518 [Ascoidea rubescens DSM 1968]ODV63131.1 hypothetical protein ASCRUDRAFT_74518 [Ascoidea rubescens DSM 1968]